jgi:hypothetical protein
MEMMTPQDAWMLNAQVAAKVMGWEYEDRSWSDLDDIDRLWPPGVDRGGEAPYYHRAVYAPFRDLPSWATDMGAAWEVVDATRGWDEVYRYRFINFGREMVQKRRGEGLIDDWWIWAEPEEICRAALAALDAIDDRERSQPACSC